MNALWFFVGVIVGAGGYALWYTKGKSLKAIDWVMIALWLALLLFSVALVATLFVEPFFRHQQAATVSALIFGLITVISGIPLFRRILAIK
jgi:antibiotic biosynthesis monooxygenase (ABM) superfamily enzyme